MTIFQGYDGELRISEFGFSGTTYYLEVLFCEMDFNGPIARPFPKETLILDRGRMDQEARHIEGDDMQRYEPLTFSFSCRLSDTTNTRVLNDILSGCTIVADTALPLYSFKGKTTIDGHLLPDFEGNTGKYAYRVELVWDGSNKDYGIRYEEVYFDPMEQQVSESPDGLMFNCVGKIYGDISRVTTFAQNTTIIDF